MKTYNQEPTKEEELAANAELAVALFAQAIGADYSEVEAQIVTDFRRYQETQTELDGHELMNEYVQASGKGEARRIVEANHRYPMVGDKVVSDFFDSIDEMFAPRHANKEGF